MARPNFFKKVYEGTQESQRLQDNIEAAVAPLLRVPILNGRLVSVDLVSGSNRIEHKLNRKILGYIIVKKNANVNLYDTGDDELYLNLQSNGAAKVSLWIF